MKEQCKEYLIETGDQIAQINSQDNYIAEINSIEIPSFNDWLNCFGVKLLLGELTVNEVADFFEDYIKMCVANEIGEENMKEIKIKYFTDKIEKLRYIDGKSDWIDLRAAEDVTISAGDFKLIPLGVAMQLPEGYEAHIVPRSSTFKNYGVIQTNHMGVVDETYCGDNDQWFMPVYAARDTVIKTNDRICQFRIMEHQPKIEFTEVDELNNADRGGHGSSGKQ